MSLDNPGNVKFKLGELTVTLKDIELKINEKQIQNLNSESIKKII